MKTIELSRGLVALVDDTDFEHLNQFTWFAVLGKNTFYAIRHCYHSGKRTTRYMHRDVLKFEGLTDHENGVGLDNRKINLRPATRSQNATNAPVSIKNTSGFKGVSKSRNKWRTMVSVQGKQTHIGTFGSAEEAARAYDLEAKKNYGGFARLNFP